MAAAPIFALRGSWNNATERRPGLKRKGESRSKASSGILGIDTFSKGWILGGMQTLLATLAAELERPRPVSSQVIKHLTATYAVEREAIGTFLAQELSKLEDYEIDLILSPLF